MEEEQSNSLFHYYSQWNQSISPNQPQPQQLNKQPHQDLHALLQAKERFLKFANDIAHEKNTHIRSDILLYAASGFKKQKIRQQLFDYCVIVRNVESRIQKMKKTRKIKKNWGEQDLKILVWTVSKYCCFKQIQNHEKQLQHQDWNFIACLIPGVNAQSCMFKWLGLKKVTLAQNSWTNLESSVLRQLVASRKSTNPKHCSEIKDWKDISQELYSLNQDPQKCYRNAKQCREHWTCYLSPKLKKGPWTLNEDVKLFQFIYGNKGSKRWSQIAKQFNGRTENALKNRYTLLIEKQRKLHRKSVSQLELIKDFLDKSQMNQIMQSQYQEISQIDQQRRTSRQQILTPEIKVENQEVAEIKVEKMDLQTFSTFSFDFWRSLQPGVIQPNGQFTKIHPKQTQLQQQLLANSSPYLPYPSQPSSPPNSQEQLSSNPLPAKHKK